MYNRDIEASQTLTVYRADHFRVSNGANLGDSLGTSDDVALDDVYRLSPVANAVRLSVIARHDAPFQIGKDSEIGQPGADLHLDCVITLMSGTGETSEALVLVETDAEFDIAGVYLLPLADMQRRVDYVLVGIDTEGALQKFAQLACVSFTRGTLITMATGAQRPVEDLKVGDKILTRDDGPQTLRWIGHRTVRATGDFAPILIKAGTLNNTNDLVVSPDHRLFIYQRVDRIGAGRAELLVRVKHLVNETTIVRHEGGFVEYYEMLFDRHQIIYAEGIAAETMLLDTQRQASLPDDVQDMLEEFTEGHSDRSHQALEVQEALLKSHDVAAILRKSSSG